MLGGGPTEPLIPVRFGNTFNGQINGFRSARCEDQFMGFANQQIGQLLASLLDGFTCADAERMGTGRVGKVVGQEGHHSVKRARV